MKPIEFETLFGLRENHLIEVPEVFCFKPILIDPKTLNSFQHLHSRASSNNFSLKILSGFRSFHNQLNIWNQKARGERTLLDDQGNELDYQKLNEEEILFAILRWSALPGLSRHHWGSDLDIYDHLSLPTSDYQIQLTPNEHHSGGIFDLLHCWLDDQITSHHSEGFFRPYQKDLGGVAPERWHLSYSPISHKYFESLNFSIFKNALESDIYQELELLELVKEKAAFIFKKYFQQITGPLRLP